MRAGDKMFINYMMDTTSTHGDKKSIARRICKRLDNAPKLIGYSILFFTLKIGAEQLALLFLRHK